MWTRRGNSVKKGGAPLLVDVVTQHKIERTISKQANRLLFNNLWLHLPVVLEEFVAFRARENFVLRAGRHLLNWLQGNCKRDASVRFSQKAAAG